MLGLMGALQAKVARLSGAVSAAEKRAAAIKSSGRVAEASRRVRRVQEDMVELERANAAMERMLRERGVGAGEIRAAVDRRLFGAGAEVVFGASREVLRRMVGEERARGDRLEAKLRAARDAAAQAVSLGGGEEVSASALSASDSASSEAAEAEARGAEVAEVVGLRARVEALEAEVEEVRRASGREVELLGLKVQGMEAAAAAAAEENAGRPEWARALREAAEGAEEELAGARAELATEVRRRERREGELALALARAEEAERGVEGAVGRWRAEAERAAGERDALAAKAAERRAEAEARVKRLAATAEEARGSGDEARARADALEAQAAALGGALDEASAERDALRAEADTLRDEVAALRPVPAALEASHAALRDLEDAHARLVRELEVERAASARGPPVDAAVQTGPGTRWRAAAAAAGASAGASAGAAAGAREDGDETEAEAEAMGMARGGPASVSSAQVLKLREVTEGLRARVTSLEVSLDVAHGQVDALSEELMREGDARRSTERDLGRARRASTRASYEVGGLKARLAEAQRHGASLQRELAILRVEDAERVARFEKDLADLEHRIVSELHDDTSPGTVMLSVSYTADSVRRRELEEQTRRLGSVQEEVAHGHAMVEALSEALSQRSAARVALQDEMDEVEARGLRVIEEAGRRAAHGPANAQAQLRNAYLATLLATNALQVSALRDEMEDDGYAELMTRAVEEAAQERAGRDGAAREIQRRFRGFHTRRHTRVRLAQRHDAAVVIQRHFRGHATRLAVKDEVQERMETRHRAATIVQAYASRWARRALVRKQILRAQSLTRRRGQVLRKHAPRPADAGEPVPPPVDVPEEEEVPPEEPLAPRARAVPERKPPRAIVRVGGRSGRTGGDALSPLVRIAEEDEEARDVATIAAE